MEALAHLEHHRADVAAVDLRMPQIGGLEVLQAIRRADPDCQVILMSGDATIAAMISESEVPRSVMPAILGAMTDERMKSFFDKMVKAGLFKANLDYRKSYTLQFVNKGVGLDLRPKN